MKAPLRCRIARRWNILLDQPSAHVAHCADCQAHFRAQDRLSAELLQAGRLVSSSLLPSKGLEQRIVRSALASRKEARIQRGWRRPVLIGGAAVAALVAALYIVPPTMNPTPATSAPRVVAEVPVPPPEAVMIVEAIDSFSTRLATSMIPQASALVARNPLRQEIDSVYADALSALDFLALNFLPKTTPADPQERPPRTG